MMDGVGFTDRGGNKSMAGRTERVNARDILNRAEGIIFEGDVVRDWLNELERRARGTLKAASTNRYFDGEWKLEYLELSEALQALHRAKAQLEIFEAAVAKRERPRTELELESESTEPESFDYDETNVTQLRAG
jgi:hypothetical protein